MEMNSSREVRQYLVDRLERDVLGPLSLDNPFEVLEDYPTDKYLTGVLFPQQTAVGAEDDDELAAADEGNDGGSADSGTPLSQTIRPASAGLSFTVSSSAEGRCPTVVVAASAARYLRVWLSPDGQLSSTGAAGAALRWQREPLTAEVPVECLIGKDGYVDLANHGMEGLALFVRCAASGASSAVTLVLINKAVSNKNREENESLAWFQTQLIVRPGGETRFLGRESRSAGRSPDRAVDNLLYRNVQSFATGHTCSAKWQTESNGSVSLLATDWIPKCVVESISPDGDPVFDDVRSHAELKPFSVKWLAEANRSDVVKGLSLFVGQYEKWIASNSRAIDSLPPQLVVAARTLQRDWSAGAARMRRGIVRLRDSDDVFRAFQLANAAMALQWTWAGESRPLEWRPFQIAFQLLTLESTLDGKAAERDVMDLLWFPTGGGKTEAYLALIALLLFYRRLNPHQERDGAGVAVIMRYTLRVLTTQQFERAARVICACEYLRNREKINLSGVPLSIGLWIGSSSIPNTVAEAHNDSEGKARQLRHCPMCGSQTHARNDHSSYTVQCTSSSCFFGNVDHPLPVWTVDEDVYRVAPSLVIGTIDKFAQIARNENTGVLFGIGTIHRPPDLVIQDELHLISGPLGTVAALYEIAIDAFCAANGDRPKLIGSTATIRQAAQQVRSIFDRIVYQFPSPGIDLDNSCFAVRIPDSIAPGRLYAGISTAGRSAKFTLQAVCASLLQSGSAEDIPADHEDDYWTLVTYFNSLRELGGAHVMMLDDVPKSMGEYAGRREDERVRTLIEPAELTSRLSQGEIPEVLEKIGLSRNSDHAQDVLLATNMISVGVDIPRLAMMVVNGQPKTIAEYIQATSRVGRRAVPGLVTVILNNNKPRDRSHFETFSSWHDTLYRDVEPTSVTPFASRALDKALRAVVVALVRHLVPAMKNVPTLTPVLRDEVQTRIQDIVLRATSIDQDEKGEVERLLDILLDEWEKRGALKSYWNDYKPEEALLISSERAAVIAAAHNKTVGAWAAPNSMRDVEPTVEFKLIA